MNGNIKAAALFFTILIFFSGAIYAQADYEDEVINCDSLYERYTFHFKDEDSLTFITIYEEPAMPIGGFKKLTKTIASPNDSSYTESVPFKIFINEKGEAPCPPLILKLGEDWIKNIVLEEISKVKFSPAMQRGKRVPSVMYSLFQLKMAAGDEFEE